MARLAKLSPKNQITLPKDVISHYAGTEYFEIRDTGEGIYLEPVKTLHAKSDKDPLDVFREHVERLGITEKDVADAVKWARTKRRSSGK